MKHVTHEAQNMLASLSVMTSQISSDWSADSDDQSGTNCDVTQVVGIHGFGVDADFYGALG